MTSNWLRLAVVAIAAAAYVWVLPSAFGLNGSSGSDSYPYPYPYPYTGEVSISTSVRDGGGVDVTGGSVVRGTVVHDEATVTRAAGTPDSVPNPTGTVDFTLYDNGTCNGNVVATTLSVPLDTSGFASSSFYTTTSTGTFSYWAHYSGDQNYQAQYGPCESFKVKAKASSPSTAGYWKNHTAQLVALLPVSLGNFSVTTGQIATAVFNAMNCSSTTTTNAIGCLAGQLLAATLNVKNGASNCIDPTIVQANALLVAVGYQGPSNPLGSTVTSAQRNTALQLKTALDKYNNGKGC